MISVKNTLLFLSTVCMLSAFGRAAEAEKNPVLEYRDVRMEFLSSKEVAEFEGNKDMVILPVGCFEMHGPIMPLGTDAFCAWGKAIILAKEWKCLAMPPVFYTYGAATAPWKGTTDISIAGTNNYITEVVESLYKNGFKRVVIVGHHGPLKFQLPIIVRDIHQRTGNVPLYLGPRLMGARREKLEGLGYESKEDIQTLAAMKILGFHGAYDPACSVEKDNNNFPFDSYSGLWRMKADVAWTFTEDHQHTSFRKDVKMEHADQAIAIMKKKAKELYAELPALFAQYIKDTEKMYQDKPWDADDVWTETK